MWDSLDPFCGPANQLKAKQMPLLCSVALPVMSGGVYLVRICFRNSLEAKVTKVLEMAQKGLKRPKQSFAALNNTNDGNQNSMP